MTAGEFFRVLAAMGCFGLLWLAGVVVVALSTPSGRTRNGGATSGGSGRAAAPNVAPKCA